MTFANFDLYFHMVNHYRKIQNAKAVVDCSSPKGYPKKTCECKSKTPPCAVQPPTCTPRNYTRSCSPSFRPICPGGLEYQRYCASAPPCRRPDWSTCRHGRLRAFSLEPSTTGQAWFPEKRELPKCTPKVGRSKTAKSPQKDTPNERHCSCSPTKPTSGKSPLKGDTQMAQKSTGEKDKPDHSKSAGEKDKPDHSKSADEPTKRKDVVQEKPKDEIAKTKSAPQDKPADETKEMKSTDALEHEYVHFLLKITEDILRNNIYAEKDLDKLFESHIEANKGRLDEDRMRAQIESLKQELNLPFPQIEICECTGSDVRVISGDCSCCCPTSESGAKVCDCNNPACPRHKKIEEKPVAVEQDIDKSTITDANKPSVTEASEPGLEEKESEIVSEKLEEKEQEEEKKQEVCCQNECCLAEECEALYGEGAEMSVSSQDVESKESSPIEAQDEVPAESQSKTSTDHQEPDEVPIKTDATVPSAMQETNSHLKMTPQKPADGTESQIVYYNPLEGECTCSVSLQKTALKIQVENNDEEYVLVDGPVCMPRTMLENSTIPVLIQNVSSVVLEASEPTTNEPSFSKVNLFHDRQDVNVDDHNVDSVSGTIRNANRVEQTDYDLTPERETAGEVVVEPATGLGSILKKESLDKLKENKEGTKTVVTKEPSLSESEKDEKEIDRVESGGGKKKSSKSGSNENEVASIIKKAEITTDDKDVQHINVGGDSVKMVETFDNKAAFRACPAPCSATKDTACGYQNKIPKEEMVKDAEIGPIDGKVPPAVPTEKKLKGGKCRAEDCPKKLKRRKLTDHPSDKRGSDFANKYHFLLMDAATSTSSCQIHEYKTVMPSPEPLMTFSPAGSQEDEHKLLVGDEYQVEQAEEVTEPPVPPPAPVPVPAPADSLSLVSSKSPSPVPSQKSSTSPSPVPSQKSSTSSASLKSPPPQTAVSPKSGSPVSSGSSGSSVVSEINEPPEILDQSAVPPGLLEPSMKDDLTYTPQKASESTTDRISDMGSDRPSISKEREVRSIMPESTSGTVVPLQPVLKQVASSTSTPSSQKPHEPLKVRYSLTREIFDAQNESLIAKLDEVPGLDADKENAANEEKMREFRKIDADNVNRRFKISDPEDFEIKKVAEAQPEDNDDEDKDKRSVKPKCCGLGQQAKSKKKKTSETAPP